ncbi:MAG: InlB B-repeat-containing protein [Oscillospiraceae bacterium]|nr:InlB B-repeat-containing protein [Oscillospiraceae bacterium]
MKQVLKRFLVLALIVAMVAAIVPAASAAATPLESATEGILGLEISYDGGKWEANQYGYRGGTMTVPAEGCGGTTTYTPIPSKLTLKNDTSQPATLAFDYLVELNSGTITINGLNVTGDGDYSISLSPQQSIDIDVLSCDFAEQRTGMQLYNVSFTVEEDVHVTFSAPQNGTYTVDGHETEQGWYSEKPFGSTFHVVAQPAAGYTFLGWFNDLDFTCLSANATDDLLITCDCVVYPYFFNENTLQFKVGTQTFTDLNAADAYASSHGHDPIILLSDGELSAGTYTISQGNTLLIPCSGEFELYTTDPDPIAQNPSFNNTSAFRTLTLASGATLNINGALSLAGKQNMSMPCIGSTSGKYGFIQLNTGSEIIIQNSGKLYCWGYICGGGEVTAKKGATVYEPFQVMDFRGGTATMAMMNSPSKVFPVSQYYVQNIESRLTLEYGAKELVRSVTNAGGTITPATVPFIDRAGSNSLFQMENGCTFTKYYNAAEDRVCFEVNGDCSINTISLTVVGGDDGLTVNSGEYMLPLNGNFDVEIQSGTLTVAQDMYIQPGASITIDEEAELYIPYIEDTENPENSHAVQVIIYDSEDWGGYCGNNNETFCPIRYTPSGPDNIREAPADASEIDDAFVDVNGTITIDGELYTTQHGACVTSTEGTGRIVFNNDAPAASSISQASQSGTNTSTESVVMTSVQLNDGNGNYTSTENVTADSEDPVPFGFGANGWIDAPNYDVTYNVMGSDVGSVTDANSSNGIELPTSVSNGPQGYTFVGWSETEINGESTQATILTGNYAPQDDTTLYAVFVRTNPDFAKVTSTETFDGKYLIVYEGGSRAFNSAFADTGTGLNKADNYVTVEITNGTIPYSQTLDDAAVEIHPHGSNGKYTIQIHCGSYLGNTGGSSTGFNVNGTTEYENGITVSNGTATIQNVPTTGTNVYTLRYNATSSGNRFGFYKTATANYPLPALYRMGTNYYTTKLSCLHTSYNSTVTAPGCLTGGYTTNVCTNCGYTWITDPTDAVGHIYSFVITEPTAEDQGYTTYTCTVCGDTYDGDYTDPTGYDWTVNFYAQGQFVESLSTFNSLHGGGLPASAPYVVGYTFRGWSESQLPDEVASANVLSGYYTPPRDGMNLYAVYTRSSAANAQNNGDYIKVANGDQIYDGGKYIFVAEGNTNRAFCVPDGARVDEGNDTSVTIDTTGERNRIAATTQLDNGNVTINYAFGTNAYTIMIADGRYIGNTGSSAGINANAHTVYTSRISVDGSGYARILNVHAADKADYTLRYQGKFSYYKATNGVPQSISLYYKDGTGDQLYFTTNPQECEHRNADYVETPATCTTDGFWTWTCPDCNATWFEPKQAALGHDYVAGTPVAPSAANDYIGYTTYTCSRCGDSYDADYQGVDFTVRLSVRGVLGEPQTVNSYYGISLPASLEAEQMEFGYDFVGWSETEIATEHELAETHKGVYHPTGNVTLYATFARFVESDDVTNEEYVRINQDSGFASGGRVLLVCEDRGDGEAIAFNGNADPLFSTGNYIYVTINENANGVKTIAASSALTAAEISVKPIAGTHYYTMQIRNNKYIGSTGNTTGINQNNKPNYRTSMLINAYNNAVIANVDGKHSYNFMYNSASASNRFGFYTPTGNSAEDVALYYKEGSEFKMYYTTSPATHVHEYELYDQTTATCTEPGVSTYVCVCGDSYTETVAALGHDLVFYGYTQQATCTQAGAAYYQCSRCDYNETRVIPMLDHADEDDDGVCDECFEPMPRFTGAQLALNEDIDVLYTAILPEDRHSASVSFTIGNDDPIVVTNCTDNGDNTYTFVCEGITPQRMGDNISATLTVNADNSDGDPQNYTDTVATYSVRQYCLNKLEDGTISASLRKLLSDTLAYGAAAQTYTSYRTNALVTADATNPTYSTFTALSGLGASFEGTADANTYWTSAGLTLQNNVAMTFRFAAPSVSGLTVRVTLDGKTTEITEFTSIGNGIYQATFAGIGANDFAKTVTASFYKNGTKVGNTVSYSVNAYVCAKQNDSNTALANLVKALYNYGASAAAYAN